MPTLALSMIVRNAATSIRQCLESARPFVDEIYVADTGSTDATPELARGLGAKVIAIAWENDFARARNRALAEVRTDWVLVLDADELLDPSASLSLPGLLNQDAVLGYLVTIRNYVESTTDRLWDRSARVNDSRFEPAQKYPAYVEHENVRLFRRHPEIYFTARVHETVGARIEEMGGRLGQARFWIHHFGLVIDAESRAAKNRLYRDMGRQKILEMPTNAQAHFELGLVEFDNFHNNGEAFEHFQKACELNPALAVSWLFAGLALLRLGRPAEALHYLEPAGSGSLAAEARGDAYYNLGRFSEARKAYLRAGKESNQSASLQSKLGLAEMRDGRLASGIAKLRDAVERQPGDEVLHDRLVTALGWSRRLEEAAAAAEQKILSVKPDPQSFLRAASILAQLEKWQQSAEILHEGLCRFPNQSTLQQAFSEVLTRVQTADPPEAANLFRS